MSSDVYRPARRTKILSPSASHSNTEPGPTPRTRRTLAGTEICPCEVSLDCAMAMAEHYRSNGSNARLQSGRFYRENRPDFASCRATRTPVLSADSGA